jgi:hypothetical protein
LRKYVIIQIPDLAKNLTILGLIACLCLLLCPHEMCYGCASTSLGSTYGAPSDEEIEKDYAVANFIKFLAIFRDYEKANNWYGDNTTTNNVYIAAIGVGELYAIAFYIGHGDYESGQYYIYDDDGNEVYDKNIYKVTPFQRLRFAIIWSCYQAYTIGGHHPNGVPYGMPMAWLHTNDLDPDGYTLPNNGQPDLVFIGFKEYAPDLTYDMWGAEDAGYHFLLHFYASALYCQETIKDSLDDASSEV